MPNRRSKTKILERQMKYQQRLDAKNYVLQNSFCDKTLAETVCVTSREDVLTFLGSKYMMVFPHIVCTEPGEVLIDSRGSGTFQRR